MDYFRYTFESVGERTTQIELIEASGMEWNHHSSELGKVFGEIRMTEILSVLIEDLIC